MPISPLPEGTVRQLGSTLVITSPVLLLKELVDNAIDSGASSIDVLVSPNTVAKVEVRDNGHGICPDDFDCLGRPGHTSKLKSFDELGTLGGTTLGFRGAALASANILADVSLTTRVPTEHVATVISLAKGGGVATLRHVGAPVGTTVTVTNLFSRLPVRSQVATKEAPKNLIRMKDLLQSYAVARPCLKLRFTVLKTPSLSWSYAPTPNAGVKEAVMQLFGTGLASECIFKVFPSERRQEGARSRDTSNGSNDPTEQQSGPIFEVLLPRPGADPRKIAKGAYLSVDSRPVSPARETAKKLVSMFKRRLGKHIALVNAEDLPRDPFIRLNIRCPPGSYDVNIEPSKDDVLFRDEGYILDQFDSLLASVYSTSERPGSLQSSKPASVGNDKTPADPSEAPGHHLSLQATAPSWRVDMSSGLDGVSDAENDDDGNGKHPQGTRKNIGEDILSNPESDINQGTGGRRANEGLNPWSIAKLTSTARRMGSSPQRTMQEDPDTRRIGHQENSANIESDGGLPVHIRETHLGAAQGSNLRRRDRLDNPASQGRRLQDVFGRGAHRETALSAQPSHRHDRPRGNRGLQSPPTSSPLDYDGSDGGPRPRRRTRYGASTGHLVQSQISFARNNGQRDRQRDRHQVDTNLDQAPSGSSRGNRRTRGSMSAGMLDVEDARLLMADSDRTRSGHAATASQAQPSHEPLPHSAPKADVGDGSDQRPPQPDMLVDDPRTQLIKQQSLLTQNPQKKLKRLKTEQLPLEKIPQDLRTCSLLLTMKADGCTLAQLLTGAIEFDAWLADGKLRVAFKDGTSSQDAAVLVERLLARMGDGQAIAT